MTDFSAAAPDPSDSPPGPLAGLRVIDLTDDLGRFATKLLAEHGASVVRRAGAGSRGTPMIGRPGGVLDWWFNAATVPVDMDLTTPEGRDVYRRLAATADLVIDSTPVGFLAGVGADHADLVALNPTLVQVSLTPFGRTGPRAHWRHSDMVAGAMSGVLSITGPPDHPLNSWGGQNDNFGGFAAAICALAGVRAARRDGVGQLVDVSLHEVVTGSIENLFMQYFYDDELPPELPALAARQGSLHWLGAYEVVPARTGNVMVTPTPQPENLIGWMVESGLEAARVFDGMSVEDLLADMPALMATMRAFARTRDAGELFTGAQSRHVAFGEVQTVEQVLANPQFAHREFLTTVDDSVHAHPGSGIGLDAVGPVIRPDRLVRFTGTPTAPPGPPVTEPRPVDEILARWAADPYRVGGEDTPDPRPGPAAPAGDGGAAGSGPGALPKPLDGLVVLDLSWVLAGPFGTRILGDLGADVIKVQTEERATLVNRPDYPYYPVWNRSKRSLALDLKHPDALAAIRPLIERADVVVENYSSGVLERLGLGWSTVREWNDRLVYISMSGCGHTGPWADVISYAPTVHALCGLTFLTNPVDRGDIGCGYSLNDHAAGFAAAFSVLAALEARRRTGTGQYLDMAQLEVGAYLLGPALINTSANRHVATACGNRDGLTDAVPNDVYPCADGRWLAVTATDDAMWARLRETIGPAEPELASVELRRIHRHEIGRAMRRWCDGYEAEKAMELLQGVGVAAGVVQNAADLAERDPQLAARDYWVEADSLVFGRRRHDRFPALWSRSDLSPYRPAPNYLGEASIEVMTEVAGVE
ncbi:MAG: CoA transferase, partial [Acidimicrobiales bacterium]